MAALREAQWVVSKAQQLLGQRLLKGESESSNYYVKLSNQSTDVHPSFVLRFEALYVCLCIYLSSPAIIHVCMFMCESRTLGCVGRVG